jgi:hypothetical protein
MIYKPLQRKLKITDYSEFVQGIQVIYFAMNTIFEAKCTGLFCIFEI